MIHEPAFKHAAIAVGCLHEIFDIGEGSVYTVGENDGRDHFALQQYNLAIKYLVAPFHHGNYQAVDICLASCVLFTCFEVSERSINFLFSSLPSSDTNTLLESSWLS